jgi:hypothetical protein
MANTTCKNCTHLFKGNFCPQCGQSAKEHSINATYFLHDIPHSILHIDKGFAYTLKELFIHPGKMLKEYLAGKRVRHFKPFAFVIILSTICTLLKKGIEYLLTQNNATVKLHTSFFTKYPALLIFLMIPILSLVTWLFFKKRGFNYWEHFLVNTYLAACLNIFFLLIDFSILIKNYIGGGTSISYTWFMVLFMTFYGFAFARLINDKQRRWSVTVQVLGMNFILAMLYMTAFSVTGLMAPWWHF